MFRQTQASQATLNVPFAAVDPARQRRHRLVLLIGSIAWLLAIVVLVFAAYFAHTHRGPIPFELTVSKDVQAIPFAPWIQEVFRFFTMINDPLPDAIYVPIVLLIFVILRWFRQAIFLALCTGIGNGIDALIGDVVGRPRPSPKLIHVDSLLKFNSFPSGHSCHMMVFYGFLLYLSFTRPVRQSRYAWLAIPFQIFAIFTILIMGFARIWEGEHWITDVVGGYLDGFIWLLLFIFLYNWTTSKLAARRARRQAIAQ